MQIQREPFPDAIRVIVSGEFGFTQEELEARLAGIEHRLLNRGCVIPMEQGTLEVQAAFFWSAPTIHERHWAQKRLAE